MQFPDLDTIDRITREVFRERTRQMSHEGYDTAHDDEHVDGELAKAAACYIHWGAGGRVRHGTKPADWPWDAASWKPKNPRADLIRAAALIVAEIERLDRQAERQDASAGEHPC